MLKISGNGLIGMESVVLSWPLSIRDSDRGST